MENPISDQDHHLKGVVEALLFVNEKPVTLDQMKNVLETVALSEIKRIIEILKKDYEASQRGIAIVEIAQGYQMLSNPLYVSYVRGLYKSKHKEKLSKPALESLAIVAYKQPVTRADIELIRGVNSDGIVTHLLTKELIKVVGRKDIAGRPYLYGSTRQFLEYFGLKSLEDLPRLEEFASLLAPENVSAPQEMNQTPQVESNDEIQCSVDQKQILQETAVALMPENLVTSTLHPSEEQNDESR